MRRQFLLHFSADTILATAGVASPVQESCAPQAPQAYSITSVPVVSSQIRLVLSSWKLKLYLPNNIIRNSTDNPISSQTYGKY
jgi:hypothetical protein